MLKIDHTRLYLVVAAVSSSVWLQACSPKVLDFRNAELPNGKVYATGTNDPFSGKLTNIPLTKLPIGKLRPLIDVFGNTTGDSSYGTLLLANGLAVLTGQQSAILCDVPVKVGLVNGNAVCSVGGAKAIEIHFDNSVMEGKIILFDLKGLGKVVAKAEAQGGVLHGKSSIFDAASGKEIQSMGWERGLGSGLEEVRTAAGTPVFKATLVNGKYEGEAYGYDAEGKVSRTTTYSAGRMVSTVRSGKSAVETCVLDHHENYVQRIRLAPPDRLVETWNTSCQGSGHSAASAPAMGSQSVEQSAVQPCIDGWIAAHRREVGPDVSINADQLEEWRGICVEGRRAPT